MSKIEEDIQAEITLDEKRAAARKLAAERKASLEHKRWIAEEQPRIVKFKQRVEKAFPSLQGDFEVHPRESKNADFEALVHVHRSKLKIMETKKGWNLFIPYETQGPWGYGWVTRHWAYELKDDADLKSRIKKYIADCKDADKRAEDAWDSYPIGNTD